MKRPGIALLLLAAAGLGQAWADPASLPVTSDPPGAVVLVDQQEVGKTPCTATAEAGSHTLVVRLDDDHETVRQTVSLQAGQNPPWSVVLHRTAASYCAELVADLKHGQPGPAAQALAQALVAPGPHPPALDFYRGMMAEAQGNLPQAEGAYQAFLSVQKNSAVGHYRLAHVEQALGKPCLADYRTALEQGVKVAVAVLAATGGQDRLSDLQNEASLPGSDASQLQLAYLEEQSSNNQAAAIEGYQHLFESMAARYKVNLGSPDPIAMDMKLPDLMTEVTPVPPANSMYVRTADDKKISEGWKRVAHDHPELAGKVLASPPEGGWTVLQARAFDRQDAASVGKAGVELSQLLGTDVVFMQVSKPATAWYWYWNGGHLVDQYCSNPGHPGEVDYRTIRKWAGRPDVFVKACHGKPVSKLSGGVVSITDLNAVLYFYYPELKSLRPGSWRSPTEVLKLLVQFMGAHDPPARFAERVGTFKPLP